MLYYQKDDELSFLIADAAGTLMKISYIYDVIYPETIGGVEKRIHEIGTRLAARGHEVHLYGMKCWDGPDVISRDGMILHGVCPTMGLYTEGRRSIFQAVRYTVGLIPHLIRADADVIDCQNFPYFPAIAAGCISMIRRKRLVITWHEFWGKYWYTYLGMTGIIGLLIERMALWLSPWIIAVSPLTARQITNAGYRGDVAIIPNGITISRVCAAPPSPQTSDIIFVGRFIPEKHPELVIDAVRILVPDYPSLRCVIVGDGPDFSSVQTRIRETGLENHITCTGFVADHGEVLSLMKSSKVFLLQSVREGFGIVALEALACGLSLVTVSHPRNAASAHVLPCCGYLAEISAEDIAKGIRVCLSRPPDPVELNRYVASHDWDQITLQLEQYYRLVGSADLNPVKFQKLSPPTACDIF